MANKKETGLIIGGAVLGLLMGTGTSSIAATHSSAKQGNEFFKFNEVKGSFQLAAAGEEDGEKKCGEKDKKCGEEDKKCGEKDKKCGEASCG